MSIRLRVSAYPHARPQLANFGSTVTIARFRAELASRIDARQAEYLARNKERNPLSNMELYVFSAAVAGGAWVVRTLIDIVCTPWSDVCARTSRFLALIYTTVFLTALVIAYATGGRAMQRFRAMAGAMLGAASATAQPGTVASSALSAIAGFVTPAPASAPAAPSGDGASGGGATPSEVPKVVGLPPMYASATNGGGAHSGDGDGFGMRRRGVDAGGKA